MAVTKITASGITFPDSTTQASATLTGPTGGPGPAGGSPPGPTGPTGPNGYYIANCGPGK